MNVLVTILGAGIGSGLMAILLAWLQHRWKKADEKEAKEEAGTEAAISELKNEIHALAEKVDEAKQTTDNVVFAQKVITMERVRYLATCFISAKKIDIENKETMRNMHKAYKALGGNGDLDTVMEEIEKLEVK